MINNLEHWYRFSRYNSDCIVIKSPDGKQYIVDLTELIERDGNVTELDLWRRDGEAMMTLVRNYIEQKLLQKDHKRS